MAEQRVDVGGLTLWAELLGDGDGEVVVLLAGMAMQATVWEEAFMRPFLASGLRALRFDWRDIGRVQGWVERGQNLSCPHLRLRDHVFGVDRTAALAQLDFPTLVLHGTDDPMFPHRHGEAIAATIPTACLELLEGRGHEVFTDPGIAQRAAEFIAGAV